MPAFRRYSLRAHFAFTVLFLIGVVAQFVLIGFGLPSLGGTDIEPHRTVGFIIHMITFLLFLISLAVWRPGKLIGLSFLLAALVTLQISMPEMGGIAAELHPFNALLVLALTWYMVQYDRELIAAEGPIEDEPAAAV